MLPMLSITSYSPSFNTPPCSTSSQCPGHHPCQLQFHCHAAHVEHRIILTIVQHPSMFNIIAVPRASPLPTAASSSQSLCSTQTFLSCRQPLSG
eukprot:1161006-Pelagomonas_calceolata.AAC.2